MERDRMTWDHVQRSAPPPWTQEQVDTLLAALAVLQARCGSESGRPDEQAYTAHAIGALYPVLWGATGESKYLDHPHEPDETVLAKHRARFSSKH